MLHNKFEEQGRMLYVGLLDICGGHLELYAFGVFSRSVHIIHVFFADYTDTSISMIPRWASWSSHFNGLGNLGNRRLKQ